MTTVSLDQPIRDALARGGVIDITTTGRKTSQPHRIEIVFHNVGGRLYISGMPGFKRERLAASRGPLKAGHRLAPVTLDLLRLSLELLDLGGSHRGGDGSARLEHGGDLARGEQPRAFSRDDAGKLVRRTCWEEDLNRLSCRAGSGKPGGRHDAETVRLGLRHRQRLERVVAYQRPKRQRPALSLLDEEALTGGSPPRCPPRWDQAGPRPARPPPPP